MNNYLVCLYVKKVVLCPSQNTNLFNLNEIIAIDLIKQIFHLNNRHSLTADQIAPPFAWSWMMGECFSESRGEPIPSTDPQPEQNEKGGQGFTY